MAVLYFQYTMQLPSPSVHCTESTRTVHDRSLNEPTALTHSLTVGQSVSDETSVSFTVNNNDDDDDDDDDERRPLVVTTDDDDDDGDDVDDDDDGDGDDDDDDDDVDRRTTTARCD